MNNAMVLKLEDVEFEYVTPYVVRVHSKDPEDAVVFEFCPEDAGSVIITKEPMLKRLDAKNAYFLLDYECAVELYNGNKRKWLVEDNPLMTLNLKWLLIRDKIEVIVNGCILKDNADVSDTTEVINMVHRELLGLDKKVARLGGRHMKWKAFKEKQLTEEEEK